MAQEYKLPKSFVPDEEPVIPKSFISDTVEPEDKKEGFLSKAWKAATTPPEAVTKFVQSVSDALTDPNNKLFEGLGGSKQTSAYAKGFIGGAVEGLGGFLNPVDIASTLTGTAAPIAAGKGAIRTAQGLRRATQALSAPVAAHGAINLAHPSSTLTERALGVAELAGGGLGMHFPESAIRPKSNAIIPEIDDLTDEAAAALLNNLKDKIPVRQPQRALPPGRYHVDPAGNAGIPIATEVVGPESMLETLGGSLPSRRPPGVPEPQMLSEQVITPEVLPPEPPIIPPDITPPTNNVRKFVNPFEKKTETADPNFNQGMGDPELAGTQPYLPRTDNTIAPLPEEIISPEMDAYKKLEARLRGETKVASALKLVPDRDTGKVLKFLTRDAEVSDAVRASTPEVLDPLNVPEAVIEPKTILDKLDEMENNAFKRLNERGTFKGSRVPAGIPVDDISDLILIGAAKMARGAIKFKDWSKVMVAHFGEQVTPHLEDIFKLSKHRIKTLNIPISEQTVAKASPSKIAQTEAQIMAEQLPEPAAVKKLLNAVIGSKGLREEQELLYRKERGKRIAAFADVKEGGIEGARKSLGKLRGELPKVDPDEFTVNDKEVETLFNTIKLSNLSDWDKATAQRALFKLLNGDKVPQRSELKILDQVFDKYMGSVGGPGAASEYDIGLNAAEPKKTGPGSRTKSPSSFSEEILAKLGEEATARSSAKLAKTPVVEDPSKLRQYYELIRGLKSVDVPFFTSGAFRQGSPLIATKAWFKAFGDQFNAYGSEKMYHEIMAGIHANPIHKQRVKAVINGRAQLSSIADDIGLFQSDMKSLERREEQIKSTLAEKIPGYGHHIKASNRSYTVFLNALRTYTAEQWLRAANLIDENNQLVDLEAGIRIANTVNELTGAASLDIQIPGSRFWKEGPQSGVNLEKSADALSLVFFSPRNLVRDARMMNPLNYLKNPKVVRMEYLKGAIRRAAVWASFTGIAALFWNADVETNPMSSDFGKIKFGDTRLDAGTGLLQWVVLAARQALGQSKSSTTGNQTEMGSSVTAPTRGSAIQDFGINRLHPTLGIGARALFASEDRPFYPLSEAVEAPLPLPASDMLELYLSDPDAKEIISGLIIAPMTSMGSQTYGKDDFGKPTFDIPGDVRFEGGSILDAPSRRRMRPMRIN